MTATEILSEVISILVGGITEVAEAMGTGISTLVQSIAFTTSADGGQTLSALFVLVLVFGGVSLALGLCRLVVNFVMSIGGKNRM